MPRPAKIWQRKGRQGWWTTVGGKKIGLGDDYAAAEKKFHNLKGVVTVAPPGEHSTEDLVDRFFVAVTPNIKRATFDSYHYFLSRWVSHVGGVRVVDLRPFHVTEWWPKYPKWNRTTRSIAVRSLKIWANWCEGQGYVDHSPLAKLKGFGSEIRKAAPAEAIHAFFRAIISEPFRDICVVMYGTGARPGEIRTLEAATIDWVASTAIVRGKRGERTISLPPNVLAILRRQANEIGNGPLLRNDRGEPWKVMGLQHVFRVTSARAGLPKEQGIVPYHLRHSFWARAINAGGDSVVVAKQLGHADLKMLQKHYGHVETSQTLDVVSRITAAEDRDKRKRGVSPQKKRSADEKPKPREDESCKPPQTPKRRRA